MAGVSEKAARALLKVSQEAGKDELAAAWKAAAKRYHPDRKSGSQTKFIASKAAFDLLTARLDAPTAFPKDDVAKDNVPDDFARPWQGWRTPKRSASKPSVSKSSVSKSSGPNPKPAAASSERRGRKPAAPPAQRMLNVNGALRQSCAMVLERSSKKASFAAAKSANAGFYADPRALREMECAAHVARSITVNDGCVTIQVQGEFQTGRNMVSFPDGTRASDRPAVINFKTQKSGYGRVPLAPKARVQFFPWAQKVEMVFSNL